MLSVAVSTLFLPLLGQQIPIQSSQPVATASSAKVAWVDMDQVIKKCDEGKRELGELQNYIDQKTSEGKALSKESNDLQNQLDIQSFKLTDEARNDLEDQAEAKSLQLQRFQQDTQPQIDRLQTRIANRILRKAQPVIEKLAREKSLDKVLYMSQVAWADPNALITDLVVKTCNATYPVNVPAPRKQWNLERSYIDLLVRLAARRVAWMCSRNRKVNPSAVKFPKCVTRPSEY